MTKEELLKAGHKVYRCHVYRPFATIIPKLPGVKIVGKIDLETKAEQRGDSKYIVKYNEWYLTTKEYNTCEGKMLNRYWCRNMEQAKRMGFGSYCKLIGKLKTKYNVEVETIKL